MFVHKDIIIVFLFIFFVNLVILVLIITHLKKINKFLNNFSGSSLKSGKLFFYKLFEPIAFNINKIIGNYEYKFRNEKVRVFFFEYFYKHFPDPLLIINQSLSIIETNLAARELIGETAQGKNIFSVLRIPELGELINESLQKRRPIESEVRLLYPKEKIYNVWISGSKDVGTNKLNFIRLFDSTSSHNIQNLQRDFIANASHELKTPVSVIIGYCETLLNDNKADAKVKEQFLKTMAKEATRMSSLVNDLLSLTRIERIEHSPPSETVELGKIFQEVEQICIDRNLFKKIKCRFVLSKKKYEILGDSSELKQVFLNIIENAVTHSNSKKAVVAKLGNVKSLITFSVEDFGIGIPNENIPLLTKRFYRVDEARSRNSGNTGLGLSIVKHIINRHNAELTINSIEGKGTKFSIIFNKDKPSLL